jgi:hypothetical protein
MTIKTSSDFIKRNIVYKGVVVEVPDDPTGYKPIKCRIETLDDEIPDSALAPCYSFLPKYINIYPKKGEYVYILMLELKEGVAKSNQEKRYYVGPIISTLNKLEKDYDDDAESDSPIRPTLKNPDKGIYPPKDYISIQGRENSDVIFRPQEIILRAGKYVQGNPNKFNNVDTAYIQIRYGNPQLTKKVKKVPVTKVTIPTYDGFCVAVINETATNCDIKITVENKKNNIVGFILKSFLLSQRNEAINFIKSTFINLKKNDSSTVKLIKNTSGTNLPDNFDLSKFKYINVDIPELKDFDINPKTIKEIKFEDQETSDVVFDRSKGSVTNIVANQINLISHANKENFKLLDPDQNITPEEQIRINTECHPIPDGDKLLEFCQLFKSFVANHVHAYSGLPPDKDKTVEEILKFDLDSLLNKNVRTA